MNSVAKKITAGAGVLNNAPDAPMMDLTAATNKAVQSYEKFKDEVEDFYDPFASDKKELTSRLTVAGEDISNLQELLDDYVGGLDMCTEKLEGSETEKVNLKKAKSELQAALTATAEHGNAVAARVDALETKLKTIETEKENALQATKNLDKKIAGLERDLSKARNTVSTQNVKMEDLQRQVFENIDQKKRMQETIRNLEQEKNVCSNSLQEKTNTLTEESLKLLNCNNAMNALVRQK